MLSRKGLRALTLALAFAAALTAAGCSDDPEEDAAMRDAGETSEVKRATGPMPDTAFRASITVPNPPTRMQPGQRETLLIKVRNTGNAPWPSRGRVRDGWYQVNLGDNWFAPDGTRIIEGHPYDRSGLPGDVAPGEEVEVPLNITAPNGTGEYTLQIDMVQEMVAWFADKGNTPQKFKVTITSDEAARPAR
jgi:hypothetical protein